MILPEQGEEVVSRFLIPLERIESREKSPTYEKRLVVQGESAYPEDKTTYLCEVGGDKDGLEASAPTAP